MPWEITTPERRYGFLGDYAVLAYRQIEGLPRHDRCT